MRVTLFAVLTVALLATSLAGQTTEVPAATKQLLHKVADSFGMLRTTDEDDAIATLRFWATGTMTVDGRPCRLANYGASGNTRVPRARGPRSPTPGVTRAERPARGGSKSWLARPRGMRTPGEGRRRQPRQQRMN